MPSATTVGVYEIPSPPLVGPAVGEVVGVGEAVVGVGEAVVGVGDAVVGVGLAVVGVGDAVVGAPKSSSDVTLKV
jgi:hypothetical protein